MFYQVRYLPADYKAVWEAYQKFVYILKNIELS